MLTKNPAAAAAVKAYDERREAELGRFQELRDRLDAQRLREWAAYGDALAAHIRTAAAALPGLAVPINISVTNLETARIPHVRDESLEERLIEQAALTVPSPADLPGTPLERLG